MYFFFIKSCSVSLSVQRLLLLWMDERSKIFGNKLLLLYIVAYSEHCSNTIKFLCIIEQVLSVIHHL